jgi:acetolactate synthase-1/2/3 large subunit
MPAAHDLPILSVVFNNAAYGAVRNATAAIYRDGVAVTKKRRRALLNVIRDY